MTAYYLSAFADEYGETLTAQIEGLQRNGIRYLEIRGVDGRNILDLTAAEVAAVRVRLDAAGIRVSALGSPIGKCGVTDDFGAHVADFRRLIGYAQQLGTARMRIFSFYLPEEPDSHIRWRAEVVRRLGVLLDIAAQAGVQLCLENEAGLYGDSPAHCRDLLDACGGRLRTVFDPGNYVLGGYDPLAAYELLRDHIVYFHIKDARGGMTVPPGDGDAGIVALLRRHQAVGPVCLTLEPHLAAFSGLDRLAAHTETMIGGAFATPEEAFDTAARRLHDCLDAVQRGDGR